MQICTLKHIISRFILFTFFLIFNHYHGLTQNITLVNPTGTYGLNIDLLEKDDKIYDSFGKMQVKLLTSDSIIISFYICMGERSYNIGSLIDTLPYLNHYTEYKTAEDSSCIVSFTFTDSNVYVKQTSDFTRFCGFGYGVHIDDTLNKTSSNTPILKDLLTDEIIKSPQSK